jgi:hypothetical protein
MTRFGIPLFALLLAVTTHRSAAAATTNVTPDFQEVYDLIRAHAAGVSDADLKQAAVQGLITTLAPKVALAPAAGPATDTAEPAPVAKTDLLEGEIAYVRVGRVTAALPGQLSRAWKDWSATNRLKGLVLDLRYARGDDYAAAAATADLFAAKAEPLLDWGSNRMSSHNKTNAVRVPVAVLVNRDTAQAAEGLAATLRLLGSGLLLGSRTAGLAMITQDFPLKTGDVLRIATGRVQLGDGAALPAEGVKPDIEVAVSREEERAFYNEVFGLPPKGGGPAGARAGAAGSAEGSNPAGRRARMSEAELVREHRQALEPGREPFLPAPAPVGRPADADTPTTTDPVLARGLDLLKGLAVVRADRL